MKIKFVLYSILVIFFSFGIYLITQNVNNNFSKIIKDNTPANIKYFLKNTIFYIPLKVREFKEIKEVSKSLRERNSKLTVENNILKNKLYLGSYKKILKMNTCFSLLFFLI